MDHKDGEGILINPKSTLRMRLEKAEVCWKKLSLDQCYVCHLGLCVDENPDFSNKITKTRNRKAINLSIYKKVSPSTKVLKIWNYLFPDGTLNHRPSLWHAVSFFRRCYGFNRSSHVRRGKNSQAV